MVKVKKFCCGCTFRTGTLILAWSIMVLNCANFIKIFKAFLIIHRQHDNRLPIYSLIYPMAINIVEIAISVIAIWAIQKNKAKYFNIFFWYLCYLVIDCVLNGLLMIQNPNSEPKFSLDSILQDINFSSTDFKIIYFAITVFEIAIVSYFALVVKNSRDYAFINEAQNDFKGPDPTTVKYIHRV